MPVMISLPLPTTVGSTSRPSSSKKPSCMPRYMGAALAVGSVPIWTVVISSVPPPPPPPPPPPVSSSPPQPVAARATTARPATADVARRVRERWLIDSPFVRGWCVGGGTDGGGEPEPAAAGGLGRDVGGLGAHDRAPHVGPEVGELGEFLGLD